MIGHIIEISMNMLHLGKPLYGLTTYNALLKKLNYFKIVGTTSIMVVSPVHSFFAAFFDITKKTELTAYLDQLFAYECQSHRTVLFTDNGRFELL